MTSLDAKQTTAQPVPVPELATLEALVGCELASLKLVLSSRPDLDHPFDPKWHATYLDAVSLLVRKAFGSDSFATPLRDVADHLSCTTGSACTEPLDERDIDFIHAFAAAEISYLVFTGTDEASAAQKTARRLISNTVPMPQDGGDPRGWVRLLKWRECLQQKRYPDALHETYEARLEELKRSHRTP